MHALGVWLHTVTYAISPKYWIRAEVKGLDEQTRWLCNCIHNESEIFEGRVWLG